MDLVTNRTAPLTPKTQFACPTLEFDFPALQIGVAEYEEGPTGCTVFSFATDMATAIDVRGGMVGKTGDYDWCQAICLAGGSLPGLEAVAGVSAALFEQNGYELDRVPQVCGRSSLIMAGARTASIPIWRWDGRRCWRLVRASSRWGRVGLAVLPAAAASLTLRAVSHPARAARFARWGRQSSRCSL